jgi:Ca2+-transporting ATPase
VVVVEEGATIPADARVIESASLQTAEAALTGESTPVMKDPAALPGEAALGDRVNMVFAGTAATYGHGLAVVTATGMQAEIGRIAGLLEQTRAEPTPLQRQLDRTGKVLGAVVIAIAVVVGATILAITRDFSAAVLTGVLLYTVSLAVSAVPEGLSAVTTVVLSLGMQRMARRSVIVRKLSAVETLGSATVICTDKTGTLTRNEMTVRVLITPSARIEVTGTGYAPAGELRVAGEPLASHPAASQEAMGALTAGFLSNNATVMSEDGRWRALGDPTEGALKVAALKAKLDPATLDGRFPRVGEVPFSSERKLMSTAHSDTHTAGRVVLVAKGAPDVLLARCTHERVGRNDRPLDEARRTALRGAIDGLAAEALRTLGLALREVDGTAASSRGGARTTRGCEW